MRAGIGDLVTGVGKVLGAWTRRIHAKLDFLSFIISKGLCCDGVSVIFKFLRKPYEENIKQKNKAILKRMEIMPTLDL